MLLLAGVLALDALRASVELSLLGNALTDEPAHVLTTALVLLAVVGPGRLVRLPLLLLAASLASVAIDLDHLPLYLGVPGYARAGRPSSHSLVPVGVLLTVALLARPLAHVAVGGAAGVAGHLLRDLFTGPGVPLLWPVTTEHVDLPYGWYLAVLVALTLCACVRARRHQRSVATGGGPAPPE